MKNLYKILFSLIILITFSCNQYKNNYSSISNKLTIDSVEIIEDSLILDEGGIYSLDALNDSMYLLTIDGKESYILNTINGVFSKKINIPLIELKHFLTNTIWNELYPKYRLASISKSNYDWIEKSYFNVYDSCIYLYYCPVFNIIINNKLKSLRQTVLLKYNLRGDYLNYFYIPDNVLNCDSCFPGFNYENIAFRNKSISININLNKDTKNISNKPLLLYYSTYKNYYKLDSISTIFRYNKLVDNDLIYNFNVFQDLSSNKNYICDGLNIFNIKSNDPIYTLDTTFFKNSFIEKFVINNKMLTLAIHKINSNGTEVNCTILNCDTKHYFNIKHVFSPILFKNGKLVYIDKNQTDENFKIYKINI